MARLPAPEDYGVNIARPTRGVAEVQPTTQHTTFQQETQVKPDVYMGEALQQAGIMTFNNIEQQTAKYNALQKQEQAKLDAAKAEDSLNQIRQTKLDLLMGDNGALKAQGGNVLDPTYMSGYKDQLDTKITGIMASLTPAQQMILKPHADGEVMGLQQDILRHSMSEAEKYKGIVRQGNIDTLTSLGVAFWNDPDKMTQQQVLIDQQVMRTAKEQGLTSDTPEGQNAIMSLRRKAMSPMLVGTITSAIDAHNLPRARQIFEENQQTIDPEKKIILGDHLQKQEEAAQVQTTAATFLSNNVYPAQTTVGKMTNVLLGTSGLGAAISTAESGKASTDKSGAGVNIRGPVIASGPYKGQQAVGTHQLMPASAKQDAAEAGIPWDEKLFYSATPQGQQYHDALQQAHLARLMKMFSTAPEIAAAYNAGEGNVIAAKQRYDKAMKMVSLGVTPVLPGGYNAERDGPLSFLDFLPRPKETKPYVSRVLAAVKATPDIVEPTHQDIEAQMAVKYPGRSDLAADATKVVEHSIDLMKAARKDEIGKTEESLYNYMGQGKTFQELPVSELSKLPPVKQDEVRKTFESHLNGTPRDSNQGVLTKINGDPNFLSQIPNASWVGPMKTQLSAADWDRFDKQRTAQLGGNVAATDNLDSGAVQSALSARMRMLNIDPTPKESDKVGQARVNSARAIIDQSILQQQRQLGRKMTELETIKHIDSLFSHSTELQSTFLGIPVPSFLGGGKHVASVMTMQFSDIPSTTKDSMKTKLKSAGITDPTDVQILTLYKQLQLGVK